MFHDGDIEKSGPWEFIKLEKNISCPRRLSAFPKINPHLYFGIGEQTVWIDACYKMTKEFVEFSKNQFPFTILRHPDRFSYYDEMLEGFLCSFFTWEQGIRITQKLAGDGYEFKKYRSPLGTIIFREINYESIEFGKLWWKYFCIGPNRDQISFDAALQILNLNPHIIEDRSICGVPLGHYNKVGRIGKHPKDGNPSQVLQKKEFLTAMRKYTGLSYIYAKKDHSFMIEKNVNLHLY